MKNIYLKKIIAAALVALCGWTAAQAIAGEKSNDERTSAAINREQQSAYYFDMFATPFVFDGMEADLYVTNAGATKETGEPNHAGNAGGASLWFQWTAPATRTMRVSTNGPTDTLLAIYTGNEVNNLTLVAANDDIAGNANRSSAAIFQAVAGTTYHIAVDGYKNPNTPPAQGDFVIYLSTAESRASSDFDGDGITDVSVFRPETGDWYISRTATGDVKIQHFGQLFDVPVPADYDGDGKTDIAVFRSSTGDWWISRSSDGSYATIHWGQNGDISAPGDYDGDGRADIAVFRPSEGNWYIYNLAGNQYSVTHFGQTGDVPAPGDYDLDNKTDLAVFRSSSGDWHLVKSQTGEYSQQHFGKAGDVPLPGDFDQDGIKDLAVFRPSEGNWYVLKSSNNQFRVFHFGQNGDVPVAGNFFHYGRMDFAIYRPSTGTWWLYNQWNSQASTIKFGLSSDIPVVNSYLYSYEVN